MQDVVQNYGEMCTEIVENVCEMASDARPFEHLGLCVAHKDTFTSKNRSTWSEVLEEKPGLGTYLGI